MSLPQFYCCGDRVTQTSSVCCMQDLSLRSNKLQFGLVIVCFALSFISLLDTGTEGNDVADDLPPGVYCDLVTTLNSKCVMTSLLEMFRYDEEVIRTTSTQEIIRAVHELDRSPWYGYTRDFSSLLGGVSR